MHMVYRMIHVSGKEGQKEREMRHIHIFKKFLPSEVYHPLGEDAEVRGTKEPSGKTFLPKGLQISPLPPAILHLWENCLWGQERLQ